MVYPVQTVVLLREPRKKALGYAIQAFVGDAKLRDWYHLHSWGGGGWDLECGVQSGYTDQCSGWVNFTVCSPRATINAAHF